MVNTDNALIVAQTRDEGDRLVMELDGDWEFDEDRGGYSDGCDFIRAVCRPTREDVAGREVFGELDDELVPFAAKVFKLRNAGGCGRVLVQQ